MLIRISLTMLRKPEETQARVKPEATQMPHIVIFPHRNLKRSYMEVLTLYRIGSLQEHRIFCCQCKYCIYDCHLVIWLLDVVQKAPLSMLPLAVSEILKIPQVKSCCATKTQAKCAIHQLDEDCKCIKVSLRCSLRTCLAS